MVEDCKSERLHEFLGLEPETITTLDELNGHINGVGEELKNYLYCLEPKYDGFYFDRRIDKDKLIIVVHPMYKKRFWDSCTKFKPAKIKSRAIKPIGSAKINFLNLFTEIMSVLSKTYFSSFVKFHAI